MGFGLLLIGYAITFLITVGIGKYLFAGMLIGGFIMFLGLSELRKYSPAFIYALIADVLLILCSFYETAAFFDDAFMLELGIVSQNLLAVFDWIEFALNLVFNIAMLYGIADLSRRVEYSKTMEKAYRNMVFVAIANAFELITMIPNTLFSEDRAFFLSLLLIIRIFYVVLNLLLIFKCYAMICSEGEENMERKPSRFKFINDIRAKQDEREQKAIESTKAYIEKKQKQKVQKNNEKKHKKSEKSKK